MGKIISIINEKGGVGKTTSTLHLAWYFANVLNKRVLAVDLDPQGNLTTAFLIDKDNVDFSIARLIEIIVKRTEFNFKDAIITKAKVDVLAGNSHTSDIIEALGQHPSKLVLIKKILEKFKDDYDYIFIDCPPTRGALTINALMASDKYYIPIDSKWYATMALTELMMIVEAIKADFNPNLEMGGIFLTRYDNRTNLSKEVEKDLRDQFKEKLLNSKIRENIAVADSFAKQAVSAFESDKRARGALDYSELAEEIVKCEELMWEVKHGAKVYI